jgi:hypothetical protein
MSVRRSGQRGSASLYRNWYRSPTSRGTEDTELVAITTDFVYGINKARQSGVKRSVKRSLDDVGKGIQIFDKSDQAVEHRLIPQLPGGETDDNENAKARKTDDLLATFTMKKKLRMDTE